MDLADFCSNCIYALKTNILAAIAALLLLLPVSWGPWGPKLKKHTQRFRNFQRSDLSQDSSFLPHDFWKIRTLKIFTHQVRAAVSCELAVSCVLWGVRCAVLSAAAVWGALSCILGTSPLISHLVINLLTKSLIFIRSFRNGAIHSIQNSWRSHHSSHSVRQGLPLFESPSKLIKCQCKK